MKGRVRCEAGGAPALLQSRALGGEGCGDGALRSEGSGPEPGGDR